MSKLAGITCFITRPEVQAKEIAGQIAALGAKVLVSPVIEIQSISITDLAPHCRKLTDYDFVIATSGNALSVLRATCDTLEIDIRHVPPVFVIGEASGRTAERLGFRPRWFPNIGTGEGLIDHIVKHVAPGAKVFYPRGQLADDALVLRLSDSGFKVNPVTMYRTVPQKIHVEEWVRELAETELGVVLFYSPSAVRAWLEQSDEILVQFHSRLCFVAIGKTTHRAINQHNLRPNVASSAPNADAVVQAILTVLHRS